MAVKTLEELKAQFETGDTPTAQDFIDLLDSVLHAGLGNFPDPLPVASGENLTNIPIPDPLPPVSGENLRNVVPREYFVPATQGNYADATHLAFQGDQTGAYLRYRRLELTLAGGPMYTEVVSASYDAQADTTVVELADAMPDNTVSQVSYGIFRPYDNGGAVSSNLVGAFTTGDVKPTFKTVADPGWALMNDGSIGNASSGATSRANADCEALFTLLWNNVANSWCPVQDNTGTPVTRGASAAADWAANRRIVLPRALGRALAAAGPGSGLTARALGEYLGEETHVLATGELPAHAHGVNDPTHGHTAWTDSQGAHTHGVNGLYAGSGSQPTLAFTGNSSSTTPYSTTSNGAHTHSVGINGNSTGITIQNAGGGGGHNTMQPSLFLTLMIKL